MNELKGVEASGHSALRRRGLRHGAAEAAPSTRRAFSRRIGGRGQVAGLLAVPQDELAVLDDEIDGAGARDPPGLRIERRLAVDHARHVLDLSQSVADRRAIGAVFVDDGGQQDDRVVGDGVEVVGLLVVFGLEFRDEGLHLGPRVAGEEIRSRCRRRWRRRRPVR